MDTANGPNSVRTVSIFDEIQDSQERSLFKELWDTDDPRQGRQRAMDFVERYPRSVVLREAYEQAARASAVLGDDQEALEWGKRALRLLPENPLLLTMVADLAARHGQHQLAETSGRQALRYLERALAPAAISPDAWPQVRDGLRNHGGFRSRPDGGGGRPLCGCRTMAAGCLACEAQRLRRAVCAGRRAVCGEGSGFGGALFRGGHERRQRRAGRGRTAGTAPGLRRSDAISDLRGVCRLAALERAAGAHSACFATRGLCRLGRLPPMPRGRISQLAGHRHGENVPSLFGGRRDGPLLGRRDPRRQRAHQRRKRPALHRTARRGFGQVDALPGRRLDRVQMAAGVRLAAPRWPAGGAADSVQQGGRRMGQLLEDRGWQFRALRYRALSRHARRRAVPARLRAVPYQPTAL